MKITMVKKRMADGSPCKKCREVDEKLRAANQLHCIDEIIYADESDPNSAGMQLSARYGVDRAPFFVVERDNKLPQIYTVYFKFVKEVLNADSTEADELRELMDSNPDLDFI